MGRIFKFDKDVDTDQIIASQYLLFPTIDEMKSHTFASAVKPGDFVVADDNFGCGSSREQAPSVLKALGVKAVIAKSFARIFYRNAINIGLPVIVCKELHDEVNAGDECELSLEDGIITVNGKTYTCTKLPAKMQAILNQGGLIASLNGEAEETESAAAPADEVKHGMTIAEKIIARAAGLSQVKVILQLSLLTDL